jgi:hypothetical protein
MTRPVRRGLAAAVPVLALLLACLSSPAADDTGPEWKPFLSAADHKAFVEQARLRMKAPLDELAGGKVDEDDLSRTVRKTRGLAMLIAACDRSAVEDGEASRRAAQLGVAVALDRALRDGKHAAARRLWDDLETARDGKPEERPRLLHDRKDREDFVQIVMAQFRTRVRGGLGVEPPPKDREQDGLESALRLLAARPDALALKREDLARVGAQTAVLAQFTRTLAPERKEGTRDPAQWVRWCTEMLDGSLELAQAARDQKPDAVRAAARKVDAGCAACHRVFRSL